MRLPSTHIESHATMRLLHPTSLTHLRRLSSLTPPAPRSATALCVALLIAGCGGGGVDQPQAEAASEPAVTDTDRKGILAVTAATTGAPIPVTSFSGKGWFVDAAAGVDTNAGTAAAPWKTLARAAKQKLAAGDAILLKCGGTWRESITLNATNAPAGRATLGTWGSCTTTNRPIVSGADPVPASSWSVPAGFAGKPVYVAPWTKAVTALYWNGTPLVQARFPNYGGIGREFKLIGSVRNGRTLVPHAPDAAVLAGVNLAGAKAVIRTNPWLVESHDVESSDAAGSVTLKSLTPFAPQAAAGYFVEGKLAMLDAAGEWFHDAAGGKLYVWLPDGSTPKNGLIETSQRAIGLTVSKVADTRVDNLVFERQLQRGIDVVDGQRTAITEVTVRDAGHTAIALNGSTTAKSSGSSVLRSTVTNSAVMGIDANSPALQINGNMVHHTGIGTTGSGVSAGIYLQSVGGVVRDNQISNAAFAGVILGHPTGVTVAGNTISQACKRFTDCGAIYTGGKPSLAQRSSITSNRISDIVANVEGAVGGATELVAGIYLDEDTATVDVVNNMISRTGVGINLHNSANNLVQANRVWLAEHASIRVHNSSSVDTVRGNVVQDNELYASNHLQAAATPDGAPTDRTVYAQEWIHGSNATVMFAGANPNVVRRNVVGVMTSPDKVRWSLLSGYQHNLLDASLWGTLATQESVRGAYAAKTTAAGAGGANLLANGAMKSPGTGWLFWSGAPAAGGKVSYGSCGAAGCADLKVGSTVDFLMSNTFRMSATPGSNLYQLRMRVQGLAPTGSLSMAINRSSDWAANGLVLMDQQVKGGTETTIEAVFNATSADVGQLNIMGSPGTSVRLLDVTVAPVTGIELLDPARESDLIANESAVTRSVDCPATALRSCNVVDLNGQSVAWPMTLAPGSARVVLSADTKWR